MAFIECVGSGGGAETPTLLWENPNPTSAYTGNSYINNINFSQYKYIVVKVISHLTQTPQYEKEYIIEIQNTVDCAMIGTGINANNNSNAYFRILYIDAANNRCYFSNGYTTYQWGSSSSLCVPLSIYGLKERPI